MGLGELVTSRLLMDVRADTSQARGELGKLNDAEKKLGDTRVSAHESSSASLEKYIGVIGQAGAAIGVAKVAFDSFQQYAHRLDLQSAAAGVSIEGLTKASHGLKSQMELLTEAARLNHTAFNLNQTQMETAETAMRALEARGNDSAAVWQAFDKALTTGATKPLEQFGIVINKAGLAVDENGLKLDTFGQKQQALQRIMEGLKQTAKEVEGEQLNAADKTQQSIIKIGDMFDMAKLKLGELVTKMEPLLASLGHAIDHVTWLTNHIPGGGNFFAGGLQGFGDLKDKTGVDALGGSGDVPSWINSWLPNTLRPNGGGNDRLRRAAGWDQFNGTVRGAMNAVPAVDRFGNSLPASGLDEVAFLNVANKFSSLVDQYKASIKGGKPGKYDVSSLVGAQSLDRLPGAGGFSSSLGSLAGGGATDLSGMINQIDLTESWMDRLNKQLAKTQRQKGYFEQVFGPAHEINLYQQGFAALGDTFNAFGNAVGASYAAIVNGQGSVSKAFEAVLGDGLMATGKASAIDALKETALGFGSLALGPLGGASASMHFQSAALHAAVAVAAGAAAHSIGTSAQASAADTKASASGSHPSAAGSSSGGSYGGSTSGGGRSDQPLVFVVGESFGQMSNRQRAIAARKTMQLAGLNIGAGHDS